MKRITLAATALLTAVATQSQAASEPTRDELLQRVEQLERMVEQLVNQANQNTEKATQASDQAAEAAETAEMAVTAAEEAGSGSSGWWNRTSIGGYGEMHYNNLNADDSSHDKKEIDFHRFVLFFGHEFTDRLRFFSELELEHALSKDTDDGSNPGEVELEQAYIEYDITEQVSTKGGVFILPIGILNETHEPNTFYGVERNNVENIIIPSTWWAGGAALSGHHANGVSWDLAVHEGLEMPTSGSNAFRVRSGRQKTSEAVAEDLAATGRVKYTGISGLELGAAINYQSDASQMSGDGLGSGTL